MYLAQSLIDGIKILALDRETIKRTGREKDLEEIFLSTLFLNYLIVLVLYIVSIIVGGFSINGRALNPNVFYALLMVYPFFFNLMVYLIYGLFGAVAELLEKKAHIRPLLSVGFHTAIVYTVLLYIIFLAITAHLEYGLLLIGGFILYFVYAMIIVLKTIYDFSGNNVAIVLFFPFLILGLIASVVLSIYPNLLNIIFL